MSWFDQTLAGMEAARLNTLHLHLSDFCRFALDLPEFPQARAPQGGGLMLSGFQERLRGEVGPDMRW